MTHAERFRLMLIGIGLGLLTFWVTVCIVCLD